MRSEWPATRAHEVRLFWPQTATFSLTAGRRSPPAWKTSGPGIRAENALLGPRFFLFAEWLAMGRPHGTNERFVGSISSEAPVDFLVRSATSSYRFLASPRCFFVPIAAPSRTSLGSFFSAPGATSWRCLRVAPALDFALRAMSFQLSDERMPASRTPRDRLISSTHREALCAKRWSNYKRKDP